MLEKITDFISGHHIEAKPEEIEAVQPFAQQLVQDYGYPKELIQVHPQYYVKTYPSDSNKGYPVDIAVFSSDNHNESTIQIIVECKRKNREDGKKQLEDYLRFSKAQLGVWYNGEERCFIHKVEKDGTVYFNDIPNIPNYNQHIEDIGNHLRCNLKAPHNLKSIFKTIRNFLFANTVGATRDEILAQQLINIIFCKIYDEKFTKPNNIVSFRCNIKEDKKDVANRIKNIFNNVKNTYKHVIDNNDNIMLDDNSIYYIVGELQNYCLIDAQRDTIADAFEIFIGHALKGGMGQFFTPRNVVKMIVELLNPQKTELLIDPACGSGGFLVESLRHIWCNIEKEAQLYQWSETILNEEKREASFNCIRGIDKDYFLAKICKTYMTIIGDGKSGIFNEDSLEETSKWKQETTQKIKLGQFDIVLTNPPFGSKIPVKGDSKLMQYNLGHNWKFNNITNKFEKQNVKTHESPQILFIERCIQLLKPGGRMAIILPDGCFGNEKLSYLRSWLIQQVKIIGVIDLPLETFLPNTSTKTSVLIIKKVVDLSELNTDYPVFMAVAETCGHDRRGNSINDDDIQKIPMQFKQWILNNKVDF